MGRPKNPTSAQKEYVFLNMNKMTTEDIAVNTGLTHKQVLDLAVSRELDENPANKNKKKLRRFDVKDGSVAMTEAQSVLGDKLDKELIEAGKKEWLKQYEKDIVPIEFKNDG